MGPPYQVSTDLVTAAESIRQTVRVAASVRPHGGGKFLFVGAQKLYVRGVTYGPFHPEADGCEYHNPGIVDHDFAQMAATGINTVRVYTVPPRWLLDLAQAHGLYVMVGLPWEQHVTFLDDRKRAQAIEARVREGVRACAGHPAILCHAIGNEIPAPIVRWYGRRRIEQFLKRLYRAAKAEDPEALFTYVNYPTTEYLQLSFVDLLCFNVYLESQACYETYLARLQNLAGDRPLLIAEIGLDSRQHGEDVQTRTLEWQVRTAFASGCAGVFLFSWTDEWYRGGYDIEDWDFGLTRRDRQPKPSLDVVRETFAEVPFPPELPWPKISVVVCSYNGARTIRDCCKALLSLDYPNYEVLVVNDGSIDATAAIASEYGFRVITTENRGLSSARNTGMEAASGEIVAYTDDDAYPDPHWLTYLATTFLSRTYAGVGGPNIPPPGNGLIAECVANAPGGPRHVLFSDREAEHIPGCNMAFWKKALVAVGGFDPQFRTAGDDVDICWRIQSKGWTLGFSHAAMVWHHRRNSVQMYWKQQCGYGKAEALLERKWPQRYNAAGHVTWSGRIYGSGLTQALGWRRWRIYHGTWGCAPFQSLYQRVPGTLGSLPLMPEWYLLIGVLVPFSLLGSLWKPLLVALPFLAVAVGASLIQAVLSAAHVSFKPAPPSRASKLKRRGLTALLHLLQPLARLRGRLSHGLTPWRRRGLLGLAWPWPRRWSIWKERWQATHARLGSFEKVLQECGAVLLRGGPYDRWDLEIRGGMLGAVRLHMAVEEHGAGKQLVRFRIWPKTSILGIVLPFVFAILSTGAAFNQAWMVCATLGLVAFFLMLQLLLECAEATATILHAPHFVRDW